MSARPVPARRARPDPDWPGAMFTGFPAATELATAVLYGWHVAFQTGEWHVVIGTLIVAAMLFTVRRMARDRGKQARRVPILGSGPLPDAPHQAIQSAGATHAYPRRR